MIIPETTRKENVETSSKDKPPATIEVDIVVTPSKVVCDYCGREKVQNALQGVPTEEVVVDSVVKHVCLTCRNRALVFVLDQLKAAGELKL